MSSKKTNTSYTYLNAKGPIEYNMTNDYMFRVVLQRSEEALKGLICSILNIGPDEVSEVRLLNPIKVGEEISDKEFRMDVLVLMNDNTTIDLEHGDNYSDVGYAYQVGFLDFTLFDDHPEFVGRYRMKNMNDGYTYTDKFNIIVIELNHPELATEDDINNGIDKWVGLFKATTWEDIKMIAKSDTALEAAAESIYISNSDRLIRKQCRDREDFYKFQEGREKRLKDLTEKNAALTTENATLTSEVSNLTSENAKLTSEVSNLTSEIASLRKILKAQGVKSDK